MYAYKFSIATPILISSVSCRVDPLKSHTRSGRPMVAVEDNDTRPSGKDIVWKLR